jgi:hypothetical protein
VKPHNNLFETTTCSRCGGSGNYSYCQMHGTTCFGCGGSGHQLTKRGSVAQKWYALQQTVEPKDVKVGDRVYTTDHFHGLRGWFRVTENDNGNLTVVYKRKGDTELMSMGLHGCGPQRVKPADKVTLRWQQMVGLAYQATLTKAGTVRKVRKGH